MAAARIVFSAKHPKTWFRLRSTNNEQQTTKTNTPIESLRYE